MPFKAEAPTHSAVAPQQQSKFKYKNSNDSEAEEKMLWYSINLAAQKGDVNRLILIIEGNLHLGTDVIMRITKELKDKGLWESFLTIVDQCIERKLFHKAIWMHVVGILVESPMLKDANMLIQLMAMHNYKRSDTHIIRLLDRFSDGDFLMEALTLIDKLILYRYHPSSHVSILAFY